jgi:hypothetical protein
MVLDSNSEVSKRSEYWRRVYTNPWVVSLLEVLFALVISNFAILIAVFIQMLIDQRGLGFSSIFLEIVGEKIKPTETIGFILGFIAPSMWIMVRHFRAWRHGSLFFAFLLVQALVILSSAIIFSLAVSETLRNADLAQSWVYWCLIFALAVWYSTLVYQRKVLDSVVIETPKPGAESGSNVLASLKGAS